MKKILATILVLIVLIATLSGCNYQVLDLTYTFDKAIIALPNGKVIEGHVDAWRDFEDGDQLQIEINGVIYLVHSEDVVLIKEK